MIDVAEAIDGEAVPVIFQAPAIGTYRDDGVAVFSTPPEPIPTFAAIQPFSGRNLRDLPEGIRDDAALVGWSRTSLDTNWTVIYNGVSYRVLRAWPWYNYTKFALQRIGNE